MAPKKHSKTEHSEENEPIEGESAASIGDGEKVPETPPKTGSENQKLPSVNDGSLDPEITAEGIDLLEQMLGSSRNTSEDEWIKQKATEEDGCFVSAGGLVMPTAEEIEAVTTGDRLPQHPDLDDPKWAGPYVDPKIGKQTNGDYGLVVQIAEGYWEGIQAQAESERMTPEAWVSMRLGEYLETWWFPPKAK